MAPYWSEVTPGHWTEYRYGYLGGVCYYILPEQDRFDVYRDEKAGRTWIRVKQFELVRELCPDLDTAKAVVEVRFAMAGQWWITKGE